MTGRSKRGAAGRGLKLLAELRVLLRAEVNPERMLRSVAALLARTGDYCIADMTDDQGVLRRLEVAHADASRREKLRIVAAETLLGTRGRVASLLAGGGSERIAHVTRGAAAGTLADIVLLANERVSSYMATSVSVSGAPLAVLTIVSVRATRRFTPEDLAFLAVIADWTGLGLENALRRQLQPRESVAPPPTVDATAAGSRLKLGGRR